MPALLLVLHTWQIVARVLTRESIGSLSVMLILVLGPFLKTQAHVGNRAHQWSALGHERNLLIAQLTQSYHDAFSNMQACKEAVLTLT